MAIREVFMSNKCYPEEFKREAGAPWVRVEEGAEGKLGCQPCGMV
jgi:hypothetical protein